MLRKFIAAALIALLSSQPANAFLHRRAASQSFAAVGNAQINVGGNELNNAQIVTNIFNSTSIALSSPATQDDLDSNSFPIANFTGGSISGQLSQLTGSALSTAGPYTFGWDASKSCFDISFTKTPGVASVLTGTGITITNGAGSGNLEIKGNCGQAGSVTITWNDATGQKSWSWNNSYTLWSSNTPDTGRMWMCRSANVGWNGLDDCTAYQAGIQWAPEFVNMLTALKPQSIRPMFWNLNGPGQSSTATLWKYRGSVNRFTMSQGGAFPIGARAGGGPSFGAITGTLGAYTSPAATDTDLTGWNTNGEWIMGNVQTASGGLLVSGIVPGTGSNCQVSVLSFSFTGTTHGTTTIDGIASTTGMYVGMPVYAADLSAGTVVTVVGANSLTLNIAATGSNTETVTGGTVTGIVNGQTVMIQNAGGIAAVNVNNLTVTAVNSGSNNFTVNTSGACAGTYTSGGWIAYQTLAITGKSGGSKLIVSANGEPISKDNTGNTFIGTGDQAFFYSSVTGHLHWAGPGTGVTTSIPPEAQIQLVNLANADLWFNYGNYASDDYITQLGTLALGSLNSNLKFYTELCNEDWNGGFQCTYQLTGLGMGAGLFTNPATQSLTPPYQALRTRQVGGLMQAVFTGGNRSRYQNLYMFQGGSGFNNTTIANQMNGSSLAILGLGYDSFPNRPIDYTDAMGYAPYVSPVSLCSATPDSGCTLTAFDLPNLTTVADNYIAGNTSTAYSAISALLTNGRNRVQTVTFSGTTGTTPLAHNFTAGSTLLGFQVTGGTTYSGINPQAIYQVDTTPTSTTFTMKLVTNAVPAGSDTNAGSAGSGTTTVGASPGQQTSLFSIANTWFTKWQNMDTNGFSPAPTVTPMMKWYEGAIEALAPTSAVATTIGLVTPSTPATTTGTTHGTTVVDSLASISNVFVGEVASAADITTGQLIASINSGCPTTCTGNYVVLSAVATGSNSGESVTFTGTAALANSTITAAITGWKNDATSKAAIQQYYNVFGGTVSGWITSGAMPNSNAPSNLILMSASSGGVPNVWTLMPSNTPASPNVFQTFCGAQAYNGGSGFGC